MQECGRLHRRQHPHARFSACYLDENSIYVSEPVLLHVDLVLLQEVTKHHYRALMFVGHSQLQSFNNTSLCGTVRLLRTSSCFQVLPSCPTPFGHICFMNTPSKTWLSFKSQENGNKIAVTLVQNVPWKCGGWKSYLNGPCPRSWHSPATFTHSMSLSVMAR